MAELHDDVLPHILKRLNVRDLIRCKSVCKSWENLISDSGFIKFHMNYSYQIDYKNNDIDRRIVMSRVSYRNGSRVCDVDDRLFDDRDCHLLGSSNGLVCISSFASQLVVANPSTREVQTLQEPQILDTKHLCWGFGYDSSTDDYKVVLGFRKRVGWTCFQVLSLKSNVWKLIGDVKYSFHSRIGILCNGALHWIMKDSSSPNKKRVIASFQLSEEKFIKISEPDDERYECGVASCPNMNLGIIEDCLCVFPCDGFNDNLWMLKNYNGKLSWEMFEKDCDMNLALQCLKEQEHYVPNKRTLCRDMLFYKTKEYICAPIYMESLVSPYVNGRPKRKIQESNSKKSCKVRSFCLSYNTNCGIISGY